MGLRTLRRAIAAVLILSGCGGSMVPYGSGTLHGKSPVPGRSDFAARDFQVLDGEVRDRMVSLGGTLLERYRGAGGQPVGFWEVPRPEPNYLAFQFGRWAVLVYDYPADGDSGGAAMTDADWAAWAASFSGRETPDGHLLLEGSGPLRLARAGEHAGPSLSFGSPGRPPHVDLFPGACHDARVSWTPGFANWCLSDSMRVHARGSGPVIEALIRGLAVR